MGLEEPRSVQQSGTAINQEHPYWICATKKHFFKGKTLEFSVVSVTAALLLT